MLLCVGVARIPDFQTALPLSRVHNAQTLGWDYRDYIENDGLRLSHYHFGKGVGGSEPSSLFRISLITYDLRFESARHGSIRTMSPTSHRLNSSCAQCFVRRFKSMSALRWRYHRGTRTMACAEGTCGWWKTQVNRLIMQCHFWRQHHSECVESLRAPFWAA